jgi:protein disulfide-isomerase A1
MRNFAALSLLGAAALAAASDVVDLKTDTFKDFVGENDLVLAECKPAMSTTVSVQSKTDPT